MDISAQRETAATLEIESGYRLESADVAQLRHSVKTGMWDEAPALLRRLGVTLDNERVRVRVACAGR